MPPSNALSLAPPRCPLLPPRLVLALLALLLAALGAPPANGQPAPAPAGAPATGVSKMQLDSLPAAALPAKTTGGVIGTSGGFILAAGWTSDPLKSLHTWLLPLGSKGPWLPDPATVPAYAAAAQWGDGLLCAGGLRDGVLSSDVTLLTVGGGHISAVPETPLPLPLAGASAGVIGNTLYVFGGVSSLQPLRMLSTLWALDLSIPGSAWVRIDDFPGAPRAFAAGVAQVTGKDGMLCIFGGLTTPAGQAGNFGTSGETWAYRPRPLEGTTESGWKQMHDLPAPSFAGAAVPLGQADILLIGAKPRFSGTDFFNAELPAAAAIPLPGALFNSVTDVWCGLDHQLPAAAPLVVKTADGLLAFGSASGTHSASLITFPRGARNLGWLDYVVIAAYFAFLFSIGVYFSAKQDSAEEFSLGNRKVRWWAAGISMFATGASAISFMAIPALAFATNLVFAFPLVMLIPSYFITAHLIFPLLRRMEITSTYEYLERRFNRTLRLISSGQAIVFQTFGRAGIVLTLPALAISAVTGIPKYDSVLLMGVLTTVYTALGGFEAVIWTEVFQGFLKLIAPLLIVFLCIRSLPGSLGEAFHITTQYHKLDFALFTWDATVPALWVVLLQTLLQMTVYQAGDQTLIQRVFSAPVHEVRRVTAMSVTCGIVIGLLVNAMGIAIFCYFHAHPEKFEPNASNDQIVPLFVTQALPHGAAGMVVAAIFASAMATVASSMNSVATIFVEDFYTRIRPRASDQERLATMKIGSYVVGFAATGIALLLAWLNPTSMMRIWTELASLLGGGIVGVYSLGMFTRRANGFGAIGGAIVSIIVTLLVKLYTPLHWTLFLPIAILSCMASGYLLSFFGPQEKDLAGLTVFTPKAAAASRPAAS